MSRKYPKVVHIPQNAAGKTLPPLLIEVPHQVNEMTATVKALQMYFKLSQADVDYTRYVLTNIHDNGIVRSVDFNEFEQRLPSIIAHLSATRRASNNEYREAIKEGRMTWVEFAHDLYTAAGNLVAILRRRAP